jgi:ectoine hydroxylase-related dioxygenase (phytanoyl-CoA dioxygenase family)
VRPLRAGLEALPIALEQGVGENGDHRRGERESADERRRGMHVSYCVGWLRTEENQYLSVPPDVVRAMPRESQELLGYAAHDALLSGGGYLGVVDLRDPVDLIADGHL